MGAAAWTACLVVHMLTVDAASAFDVCLYVNEPGGGSTIWLLPLHQFADSIGLPTDEGLFGFKPFPEVCIRS